MLLEHFGTLFDSNELLKYANSDFKNPGIEEVDYNKIIEIINRTQIFIDESYTIPETVLNVFDEDLVKEFIHLVATSFLKEYEEIITPYLPSKENTLKKEN